MKLKDYRLISADVNAAIEAAITSCGFKFSRPIKAGIEEALGTIRITFEMASTNQTDAAGNTTTPERERWRQYSGVHGLEHDWLDKTFVLYGKSYTVVGLRAGRSSKPVMLRIGAKVVCCDADSLRTAIERHDAVQRHQDRQKGAA